MIKLVFEVIEDSVGFDGKHDEESFATVALVKSEGIVLRKL